MPAVALNLAVCCLVAELGGGEDALTVCHYGVLTAWVVLCYHDAPWIWRRPSVLFVAGAVASGGAFATGLFCPEPLDPLTAGLAPWPAHLAVRLRRRWRRRMPIYLPPSRYRRLAAASFAHHPAARWRVAPRGGSVPTVAYPRPGLQSRSQAFLATPEGPFPLYPEPPTIGMSRLAKRATDLLYAVLALPLLLTIFPLLSAAVWWAEGRPIFYCQTRVTSDNRPFTLIKFRTMSRDAESEGVPVWPQDQDPRITRLGRFLRRYWLDELPQVLLVFVGHLSMVGPRPERPYFIECFARELPNYPKRHQVLAGITGLAQVSGLVGNTSISRRLQKDLRYIRHWSPWLDFRILLATIQAAWNRPPVGPS